jgi:predicted fused transcriptional regulator/phosphomethylpyrimidine kinase
MYPPCFIFIETLFSDLRIRVAHLLKSSEFTQTEIAHQLHVSQVMVSKYLSKTPEPSEEMDEVASEIAQMITQKRDEKDTVCTQLRSPEIMDEKKKVIQNIQEALQILESNPSIMKVMPEVRMNIAMGLQNASNPMEVAAVPGRLIPLHGKICAVSAPEFGASHHLASILIKTTNKAVINIKYSEEILSHLKELHLSLTYKPEEPADVLIDRGGFGIEPCAYIFGRNAVDAALTVLQIAELL